MKDMLERLICDPFEIKNLFILPGEAVDATALTDWEMTLISDWEMTLISYCLIGR